MSHSNRLPANCQDCAKSVGPNIHGKCNLCRELEFREAVLCDLNRSTQDPAEFVCHAFQPMLRLVDRAGVDAADSHPGPPKSSRREFLSRFLQSDKIQYQRALALQKLDRDPESVFADLKYHFAWNVIDRKPVFTPTNDVLDSAHNAFMACGELVGGFVRLLWLAPDHVHLFVESDAERSVEQLVFEIKRCSSNAMLTKLFTIKESLAQRTELWDQAYFVETVG